MENPAADHLPEVDSLPDGFVEGSSVESLAPSTPVPEKEKRLAYHREEEVADVDYKEEKLVELDSGPELAASGIHLCDTTCENDENSRTFPVVDSLPDGFVEGSSVESLAPSTPVPEEEKLLADYKEEEVADVDYKEEKLAASGIHLCDTTRENDENLRTFPVPLCANDDSDKLAPSVGSDACGKVQDMILLDVSSPILGDGAKVSCDMLPETPSGEILAPEDYQVLDKDKGDAGVLRTQVTTEQNISSINSEISNKEEISGVKRKNSKRNLKSEKEFLQFSLKYQQVLSERDAAVAVRDKLESLCRELQRQNKMLMDECKRVSTEGQNLRLDLSNRFQDAVKEINIKLEEQKEECLSQLKENEMLKVKLKHLADQYTLSEQQYAQKLKQKSLELQIADLKTQQHEEKLRQEQSQMKIYAEQMSQLLETERNLRLQLTADGEKFQQFQDALVKSNEVFETFKKEIEKTTKSNKELKKENMFLKSKCEKSDFTLVQLVEERELLKKQLEKTRKQKEKL